MEAVMNRKYLALAIYPYSELDPELQRLRLSRRISALQEHMLFPIGKFAAFEKHVVGAEYVKQLRAGGFRYFVKGATPFQAYALAHAQYAAEAYTDQRLITRMLDLERHCGDTIFAVFDEVLRQGVHRYGELATQLWFEPSVFEAYVQVASQWNIFTYMSSQTSMAVYLNGAMVLDQYRPFSLELVKADTKPNIFGKCLLLGKARDHRNREVLQGFVQ